MATRHFTQLLQGRFDQGHALCVGLDPDFSKMPEKWRREGQGKAGDVEDVLFAWAKSVIEPTIGIACAYKPNAAFYEAYDHAGATALHRIIRFIHAAAPGVPVILDYKRGDIGNTNIGYVRSAFELFGADAVTVSPYFGQTALRPFLDREDKGIIVLCRTSNPGAGEFQDPHVVVTEDMFSQLNLSRPATDDRVFEMPKTMPLYHYVAYRIANIWNKRGNCALVVGATYPAELGQIRRIVGDMPLLIPGIGAQGGDVEATVKNGRNSRGQGMIINASSSIGNAEDPGAEARKLDGLIRQFTTA